MLGEHGGLIEFTLAQAFCMEGNRHQGIKRLVDEAGISESLGKYPTQRLGDPYFAAVFHAVNQLPYDTPTAHDRDGALEVKRRAPAIRALEFAHKAGKWL